MFKEIVACLLRNSAVSEFQRSDNICQSCEWMFSSDGKIDLNSLTRPRIDSNWFTLPNCKEKFHFSTTATTLQLRAIVLQDRATARLASISFLQMQLAALLLAMASGGFDKLV